MRNGTQALEYTQLLLRFCALAALDPTRVTFWHSCSTDNHVYSARMLGL
jgi:hypothetical protein